LRFMKNITVFASGRGSNFRKICEQVRSGYIPGNINLLVASNAAIGACDIARKFDIPVYVHSIKKFKDRKEADRSLLEKLKTSKTDIIALAGWLKLIDRKIISAFPQRILNIHPALLPMFGGKGMYGHYVHEAVWKSGMQVSGVTIHFVNEKYDEGHILLQEAVRLSSKDSPGEIAAKVLKMEHEIYPRALKLLVENRVKIVENRVSIEDQEYKCHPSVP